jgi:phosphate transport system permease protein
VGRWQIILLDSGDTLREQLRVDQAAVSRRAFRLHSLGDPLFSAVIVTLASLILALLAAIAAELTISAMPSIRHFGFAFLASIEWNPNTDQYGALPFIYGTAVSSAIALIIAVPLSLGVALCLSEMAPAWLSRKLGFMVELLAAIPSVVYGLWAIFVLGPWLRDWIEPVLSRYLGFIPLFDGPRVAVGMLTAGVVLAIMVLPYVAAVCTDVFRVVPQSQREAALALGATTWEMVRMAVLPYGTSGIIGAVILGLGRALGETIAVAMVIGNRPVISASLFAPSSTLASVIANEFVEAMTELNVAALVELGLVLLALGIVLNVVARVLVIGVTQRRFRDAS